MPRLRSFVGAMMALALVIASQTQAHADAHEESPTPSAEAAKVTGQLTLPAGALVVQIPVEVNLSSGAVAKPLSVAPDVWYGVMDKLSVGLVHSAFGTTGSFATTGGAGVCVTGEDNGCGKVYDNVGVNARYGVLDGDFLLAADVGVFARSLDPLALAAKVGVNGMMAAGPLHIIFSPNIFIGFTEREAGNEEILNIPVTFAIGLGSQLSVGLQTGLVAPLSGFADGIIVPLAAGVRFGLSPKLGFDAAFSLPFLYNKPIDDGTNTDTRAIVFSTNVAL